MHLIKLVIICPFMIFFWKIGPGVQAALTFKNARSNFALRNWDLADLFYRHSIPGPDSMATFLISCKRKFPSNCSCAIIQTNLNCHSCIHCVKSSPKKACVKTHIVWHAAKIYNSHYMTVYLSIESTQKQLKYHGK